MKPPMQFLAKRSYHPLKDGDPRRTFRERGSNRVKRAEGEFGFIRDRVDRFPVIGTELSLERRSYRIVFRELEAIW